MKHDRKDFKNLCKQVLSRIYANECLDEVLDRSDGLKRKEYDSLEYLYKIKNSIEIYFDQFREWIKDSDLRAFDFQGRIPHNAHFG
ncbi:MAG: hypothetical protein O3C63_09175 [Cyanobacteria bacterium]|nr:hypothetical protein [Cyanobacteriota bacterium]